MPDWSCEISIFECKKCNKSWDDYECDRNRKLRKCSICHNAICIACFNDRRNKQHCHSCFFDISNFGKVSKKKNKCLVFK